MATKNTGGPAEIPQQAVPAGAGRPSPAVDSAGDRTGPDAGPARRTPGAAIGGIVARKHAGGDRDRPGGGQRDSARQLVESRAPRGAGEGRRGP